MKLIAIVFVVACGSTPPPTQPPSNGSATTELSCKTAVERAGEATKIRPKTVTMAIGECEQQAWSRQLRECVADVHAQADLDACGTKNGSPKSGLFGGSFGEAMKAMRRFKDDMCACKDSACAQKVSDVMTKWSVDMAKTQTEPPRMSDEDMKAATEIGEEMGKCMQKAMGMP